MDRQRRPRRAGASEGIFGLNRNSDFRCGCTLASFDQEQLKRRQLPQCATWMWRGQTCIYTCAGEAAGRAAEGEGQVSGVLVDLAAAAGSGHTTCSRH